MLAFAAILATLDDPFYDPPEHLVKYETPQQRRSYTAWASKLRDELIGDDSGYDKVVPGSARSRRIRWRGATPARLPSRCAATRVAP